MTLNQYIEQLKKVRNNIDGEIERIVSHPKNKGYIGGVWKRNRYAKGFLPSLGEYTDSTKRQKRAKGKTTTPFNLFDEGEWYDTLEPFYNSINESNQSVEKAETIEDTLSNIVKDLGIGVQSVEKTILEQIEMFSAPDQVIRIHTNKYISLSDMFRLETVLNNKPGVNFTLIKEKYIDVNVSPNY